MSKYMKCATQKVSLKVDLVPGLVRCICVGSTASQQ